MLPHQSKRKIDMQLNDKNRQDLWKAATQVLSQAYAPYSRFRVGASVLTAHGQIYAGANVENASYGLSLCAERAAVAQAVAAEGPAMRLIAVAVTGPKPGPLAPCGACRQVIFEFGPEALVIFQGEGGLLEVPITELLPQAFRLSR
jgi:cytidine deaminase